MPRELIANARLYHEWSPLLGYLRRLSTTLDARDRAAVMADALTWLAAKTQTTLDDRIVARVSAVLRTPEGVELVREVVAVADEILEPVK